MSNRSGVSNKSLLLYRIKFSLGEDRISITREIRSAVLSGLNLVEKALAFPWTATAYVRSWFSFKDKRFLVAQSTVFIFAWSVLFSPSVLIVILDVVKRLGKVIRQVWSVVWVRFLRIVAYYHKHGFLSESMIVALFLLPLTRDVVFTFYVCLPFLVLHFMCANR
jgi:hypothetical protein